MKLFGLDLFGVKNKSTHLYNFARWGFASDYGYADLIEVTELIGKKKAKKKTTTPTGLVLTPKGVFETKALNSRDFKIIIDPEYIKQQIADAREKLKLIPDAKSKRPFRWIRTEWDMHVDIERSAEYGKQEILSIIDRLENRKKLIEVKNIVDKYPHTTSQLIHQVLQNNKHLKCEKADSFVPDFPKEAVNAMSEYQQMCEKVCGQKTHFFVIADKKDFEQRNTRRDPILLAQSPFGFFWQILGAWDEEMIYLGDL